MEQILQQQQMFAIKFIYSIMRLNHSFIDVSPLHFYIEVFFILKQSPHQAFHQLFAYITQFC